MLSLLDSKSHRLKKLWRKTIKFIATIIDRSIFDVIIGKDHVD